MMNDYLNGTIIESIAKIEVLKTKIPGSGDLDTSFDQLVSKAESEVQDIKDNLETLLYDSEYQKPEVLKEKFSIFKGLYGNLSLLENVVIVALTRSHNDDVYVNRLLDSICKEIKYPLLKPVASCISRNYYHIYPTYNLLCVPLLESDFILHLPDIYHELGHPLISNTENPKVKKYQEELFKFNSSVKKHFEKEITDERLNKNSSQLIDYLQIWKFSWLKKWSIEFFCDLFAVFTLGPAYVWANLHLCTKISHEVYDIPYYQITSHPPEEARMQAMFHGLEMIGFGDEAYKIRKRWIEFVKTVEPERVEYYDICIPDELLIKVSEHTLEATKNIGCRIISKEKTGTVINLLNDAWDIFIDDPGYFIEWQQEQIQGLRNKWIQS